MCFLSIGGHTAEMINLLLVLRKERFTPRFYIATATDNMSLQKARVLENSLADLSETKGPSAEFMQIYRSREVGQSYVVGIRWSSIFYVESIARVKRLSLSGLLLYKFRIADQFFVQWPQLQRKYPRAHYVGCLM
ncbi:hypothetical protein CXB51_022334 [Gossypium anomalum]|uniref:UDP-N-acetylglucosamine transferase subunit ALG14 n=1 Tax=Gossypium anomalum TaxID=47600 RepID=A0A8J6CU02_9ROSI|nr:hypothetical protein CXB51_022334 [Gossypium anomalum]